MRILFILILIIFTNVELFCKIGEDKEKLVKTFGIQLGEAFPIKSVDFSKIYSDNLNENPKELKVKPIFSINYKVEIDLYRFGINSNYYINSFYDNFNNTIQTINGPINKAFNEEFQVQNLPVYLSAEMVPYFSQFRSFYGIGFGLNYSKISWLEKVSPMIYGDSRIGGQNLNNETYNLFLKIFGGIELGFDKNKKYLFLNNLSIEVFLMYFNNNDYIFRNIKEQFPTKNVYLEESYRLIPFIFGVNLGLNFNTNGIKPD